MALYITANSGNVHLSPLREQLKISILRRSVLVRMNSLGYSLLRSATDQHQGRLMNGIPRQDPLHHIPTLTERRALWNDSLKYPGTFLILGVMPSSSSVYNLDVSSKHLREPELSSMTFSDEVDFFNDYQRKWAEAKEHAQIALLDTEMHIDQLQHKMISDYKGFSSTDVSNESRLDVEIIKDPLEDSSSNENSEKDHYVPTKYRVHHPVKATDVPDLDLKNAC